MNGSDFIIGLVGGILLAMLWIPIPAASLEELRWAHEVCENNGGLNKLRPSGAIVPTIATCGNTAQFELTGAGLRDTKIKHPVL